MSKKQKRAKLLAYKKAYHKKRRLEALNGAKKAITKRVNDKTAEIVVLAQELADIDAKRKSVIAELKSRLA